MSQDVTEYSLLSTLANVHCIEILIRFDPSDFCYTINSQSLLELLLDIQLLLCVVEIW